ncbi:hypothetical protein RJ640_021829 [Escallonia rubra]|uniref:F-box associated beta-propeller type 1 domain-containing protein n=1 Tax=Escallonia rubra TaxID=112253 RepID=A0AA88SC17_9ASTE|nr:hypothetical protein RJ640_021829 [Escallonia rubra]
MLPVKYLLICKSVCKSWYTLITKPSFTNAYLNCNAALKRNHCVLVKRFLPENDENHGGESMLSLHISTEVFQQIRLPDVCAFPDGNQRAFLVLNDSIALLLFNPSAQTSFDIWLMTEYGVVESWTKQFTIGPLVQVKQPLLFWKHGLLLEKANGQLVSCDLKSQRLTEFQVYGAQESLRALIYSESLVSIKQGSDTK